MLDQPWLHSETLLEIKKQKQKPLKQQNLPYFEDKTELCQCPSLSEDMEKLLNNSRQGHGIDLTMILSLLKDFFF